MINIVKNLVVSFSIFNSLNMHLVYHRDILVRINVLLKLNNMSDLYESISSTFIIMLLHTVSTHFPRPTDQHNANKEKYVAY